VPSIGPALTSRDDVAKELFRLGTINPRLILSRVISDLQQAASQISGQTVQTLFLAICRLMQGKVADSVAPLKVALTNEDSVYTQSAHFYLAKAYIQKLKKILFPGAGRHTLFMDIPDVHIARQQVRISNSLYAEINHCRPREIVDFRSRPVAVDSMKVM